MEDQTGRPPRRRPCRRARPDRSDARSGPGPPRLYGLIFTNPAPVLAFWLGFNALQFVIAVIAFRLDGESLRPLWALPLEQFVYRQLMYLVIIESTISALVGARATWKTIPRTGDVELPPSTPVPA